LHVRLSHVRQLPVRTSPVRTSPVHPSPVHLPPNRTLHVYSSPNRTLSICTPSNRTVRVDLCSFGRSGFGSTPGSTCQLRFGGEKLDVGRASCGSALVV